ncbi:MAG: GHKL domain-containing protein [Candidatus Lokiarchaeota archaeon]|nr:GHKL domain-containing protein [Candidatus Lokiarchaeota archaeon]
MKLLHERFILLRYYTDSTLNRLRVLLPKDIGNAVELRKRKITAMISLVFFSSTGLLLSIMIASLSLEIYSYSDVEGVYLSSAFGLVVSIGIIVLNRFYTVQSASYILIVTLFAIAMFTDNPYEIAHGRSIVVFIVPILISAILINPLSSLISAGISSIIITLISIGHGFGLPNIPSIFLFFVVAIIAWYSAATADQNTVQMSSAKSQLRAERDRAMFLLDIMGHDIRNNLQAIFIGLEILVDAHPEQRTEVIRKSISAAAKCKQIITKVKRTESLTQIPLKIVDIVDSASRKINAFRQKHQDVEIILHSNISLGYVWADKYFEDLIENVLENAIEHNPKSEKKVWVSLERDFNGYEIKIADNGTGLPLDRRYDILNPERRYGGVGLHQSRHIVSKYKGTITIGDRIEGDYTSGLEVTIWLPIAKI